MSAKKGSAKWIVGGTVIAVAVVAISLVQLGDNVVYFYTPGEAHAKAAELEGKNIKLGGMVMPGTVKWVPESLSLDFTVSDLKGVEIAVSHKGTPPDMFKEGQGVVVEGLLAADGKSIQSKKLMVKHSEEYKKPGDHHSINKELLEKSMFKEQY